MTEISRCPDAPGRNRPLPLPGAAALATAAAGSSCAQLFPGWPSESAAVGGSGWAGRWPEPPSGWGGAAGVGRERVGAPAPPLGCRENGDTAFGLNFGLFTNPRYLPKEGNRLPALNARKMRPGALRGQLRELGGGRSGWAGLESESSVGMGSVPCPTRTS